MIKKLIKECRATSKLLMNKTKFTCEIVLIPSMREMREGALTSKIIQPKRIYFQEGRISFI